MPAIPIDEIDKSIEKAQQYLRGEQLPDGAWHGNCLAGPDATSEVLIALRFLGALDPSDASKAKAWLLAQQLPDGSFAAYEGGTGSIDETCITYAALLSAGIDTHEPPAEKAYAYIQAHGGFAASTSYTKVLLSVAGILAPGALPNMPIKPLLVPGIGRIIGSRFTPAYTILSMVLPAIVNALRKTSLTIANRNVIRYLTEHQNPTGNLFGVVNMTVMMLIAFKLLDLPPSDERIQRALGDLKQWRIETQLHALQQQRMEHRSDCRRSSRGTNSRERSRSYECRQISAGRAIPTGIAARLAKSRLVLAPHRRMAFRGQEPAGSRLRFDERGSVGTRRPSAARARNATSHR